MRLIRDIGNLMENVWSKCTLRSSSKASTPSGVFEFDCSDRVKKIPRGVNTQRIETVKGLVTRNGA
jgi:hypothetical protein